MRYCLFPTEVAVAKYQVAFSVTEGLGSIPRQDRYSES